MEKHQKFELISTNPSDEGVFTKINNKFYFGKQIPLLFFRSKLIFTIGPDWQYFLGMFIFMFVVGVASTFNLSLKQDISLYFIAIIITLIQLGVYMFTALINPGICYIQEKSNDIGVLDLENQTGAKRKNLCNTCQVTICENRIHCEVCDICVDGYDHHCPWTGKCIGKGNITFFYLFLISTIIFFVFHICALLTSIKQK